MINNYTYNCIFGGGGIRGMCYIGAIKALKECNIELGSIAGSSVGAVFAALIAVGYSEDEIKEFFYDFNLNMFRDLNISMFTTDISISKGEIFLEWLKEKIERKYYKDKYKRGKNQPVKFKDIKKDLYILTIDINTNTPYIFSKENTPDAEIAFAVRASASLPGLMKPVIKDNALLVDGDLIKSWPAWKIFNSFDNENSRILEFRLEGSRRNSDIKNPIDYVNSIINTIWYLSTENVFNLYNRNDRYDYIVIDTKEIILFDFNIDKTTKDELITKGYNDTKTYLTKILPEKKKLILEKYKYLYKELNMLKNYTISSNYEKAINKINEIITEITENKEISDKYFEEELRNIRKEIIANEKKIYIFSAKIKDIEKISVKINIVNKMLENRIEDINKFITRFGNKN